MSKKVKIKDLRPFSERHPRWNFFIGLLLLLGMIAGGIAIIYYVIQLVVHIVKDLVEWVSTISSTLDAVVIVALITGAVSITGVIISSIVAKSIEYRKARRNYLSQKREKPYSDFVAMYYKILMSNKLGEKYGQDEMLKDMTAFSQELTLWGSNKVVKLWVNYRTKATQLNPSDNLIAFEKILYEIRKDMGFKKMKTGTLLKFFINDFDESVKKLKK